MFPVCTPDYARRTKLEAPRDLARAVLLRCPLDPWKPWFEAARLDWPEPDSGPRFNDAGMMTEAALAGQGVALGTPRLVARWLRSGALRRLLAIFHRAPAQGRGGRGCAVRGLARRAGRARPGARACARADEENAARSLTHDEQAVVR
jgi:DNA-binding transcriptional LysR family regulator